MNIDAELMCRACLNKNISDLIGIVESGLQHVFERASTLIVLPDDVYPKYVCSSCIELLNKFEEFREKCLEARNEWRTNYSESVPKVIPTKEDSSPTHDRDDKELVDEERSESRTDETEIVKPATSFVWCDKERRTRFEGSCSVCNKVFYYKGAIIKHLRVCGYQTLRKYTKPIYITCGICRCQFSTQTDLSPHLNDHYESGRLSCEICDHEAIDFAALLYHSYSHKEESDRSCKVCFKCGRQYYKRSKLEFHFRGEHQGSKPGLCRLCCRQYTNYSQLRVHLLTHTGRVFTCDTCAKTFKYERSLSKHQSVHSSSRRFVCDLCGYSSRWKLGLKSHIYNKHEDHERISCSHCDKTFKNSIVYRQHVLAYRGEKTFKCNICGKMFKTQALLASHDKWHRDEKPFSCQICGSAFKAKGHLKHHMKIHRGDKAHACGVCSMRFVTSSALKRHAVTHTGEKPYECSACGKKFTQSANMKKHLARHGLKDD